MSTHTPESAPETLELYRSYANGGINRREFMRRATALGIAGAAASAIGALSANPSEAAVQQAAKEASAMAPLDLAEWSYFWVGVKRAPLAKGTVVNGEQMYVESFIPAQVRHPFAIIMVHGGGGQGLDWMTTPDGRPGWAHHFAMQGYRTYVVDRPGHGRSPFHPDLQGPFGARAGTYDTLIRQFTAPEKAPMPYGPEAKLHNKWAGATGITGDPTLDQVAAGQGGAFVPDIARTHAVWAQNAGELLDKVGPAVVMTHSAGGPFAWISANARPNLVVGLLPVEPAGPPFGNLRYGVAASPLVFDPPVADASELKTVEVKPTEPGRSAYLIQAEPARKLKNLQGIPIGLTTSPASYHWPYDLGTVALLKQAGCDVTHIELEKIGITGNGHFMMMERNNREVLQPILDFLDKTITPYAQKKIAAQRARSAAVRSGADSAAMKLRDIGSFWVGAEPKQTPYGAIASAASFVQYLEPMEVRHQLPVVLVHGGSGQSLHYMGPGDGVPGWAHYYVQAGYRVFLVERPGHGRGVYHPETLGPIGPMPTYEQIVPDFLRSAKGPNKRWPGTGEVGDPLVDQFMASQNALPADFAPTESLGSAHGALLLDRIGPAIVQTHSAAGAWGWYVAEARPNLVKAVVCFEGGGMPMVARQPAPGAGRGGGRGNAAGNGTRQLGNLNGMPILYFTAENSGRTQGPEIVAALNASGARAEHVFLKDRGITGNGHFAMFETNRKQVFDFFRQWIEGKQLT